MSLKHLVLIEDEIYRAWCDNCGEFVDATDLAPYSRDPNNYQGYRYSNCVLPCCDNPDIQVETLNEDDSCIGCSRVFNPWEDIYVGNLPEGNLVCESCYKIAERVISA